MKTGGTLLIKPENLHGLKRFSSALESEIGFRCRSALSWAERSRVPTNAALPLAAEPGSHFQLPRREEIDAMAAFRRGRVSRRQSGPGLLQIADRMVRPKCDRSGALRPERNILLTRNVLFSPITPNGCWWKHNHTTGDWKLE